MSCYHQLYTLGKYMKSSASFKVSLMLSQLILINVFFFKYLLTVVLKAALLIKWRVLEVGINCVQWFALF